MAINPVISSPVASATQPVALIPSGQTAATSGGLSFSDILDAVNPLQHIPVVSSLFRAATGSHISAAAQVAGDTLFGALLPGGAVAGLISSAADVAVKQVSGKDISEHVISTLTGSSASSPATTGATPLVPLSGVQANAALAAATQPLSLPPTPLSSYHLQKTNAEYQRAQALDAINRRLVKIRA